MKSIERIVTSRPMNIVLRTVHLAAMGVLLGGHAFSVPREELFPALVWTLASGVALGVSEAGFRLLWFHQVRGLMTLAKLGLLAVVPWYWAGRVPILVGVVIVGSVGSHMPARWRYYSVVHGEVIRAGSGPGTS